MSAILVRRLLDKIGPSVRSLFPFKQTIGCCDIFPAMKTQTKNTSEPTREVIPMKPEDILTPDQLAKRLQVTRSWVYEKCRRRGRYDEPPMPRLQIGRYLRFYWPDVCEWMRRK